MADFSLAGTLEKRVYESRILIDKQPVLVTYKNRLLFRPAGNIFNDDQKEDILIAAES